MVDSLARPSWRRLVRVEIAASLLAGYCLLVGGLGCVGYGPKHTDPEEEKQRSSNPVDQAELVFNRGKFRALLDPEPKPDTQLLRFLLIQLAPDDTKPAERTDLGYLREERLVVKVKPWDERSESGFVVHLPGSFKFASKEPDGTVKLWEAVDKTYWTVLNLAGNPVGIIDEFGTVYRYDPAVGRSVEIGSGDVRRAAELLFGIAPTVYFDRDKFERVEIVPGIYLTELDSQAAEERFQASAAPLPEEFDRDPLFHDKDRVGNR